MKTLYESLLDNEEVLMRKTELIDLYTLIKDKIKSMTYTYTSLGYSHGFNVEKCIQLSSKDEILKTINGKTLNPGAGFGKMISIFLKQIIVNPDFINHKNDKTYMEKSAKQTFDYSVMNDLNNWKDGRFNNFNNLGKDVPYIFVEMKRGNLYVYYHWDKKPIVSVNSHGNYGYGRIIIKFN